MILIPFSSRNLAHFVAIIADNPISGWYEVLGILAAMAPAFIVQNIAVYLTKGPIRQKWCDNPQISPTDTFFLNERNSPVLG